MCIRDRPGFYSGFLTGSTPSAVSVPLAGPSAPGYAGMPSFGSMFVPFSSSPSALLIGLSSGGTRGELSARSLVTSLSLSGPTGSVISSSVAGVGASDLTGGQSEVFTDTKTDFVTRFEPGGDIIPGDGVPPPGIPPPIIPIVPPPGIIPLPGFALPWGGGGGRGRGRRGVAKAKFKASYNPSIAAKVFGIRGTRKQARRAARTGIGVRPII